MLDVIAQLVFEHVDNGGESATRVVVLKVLDVLQYERRWAVMGDDLRSVEEQRALGVTKEPVRAP